MIELNIEVCKTIAEQYGLPLQIVVKEFIVFDVLGQITMATAPSKNFVFKGGTALSKVYLGGLQRFSEDLDFDLGTGSIEEVRERCKRIAEKLSGYEAAEFRVVRDTVQFYCRYESPLGGKDNVRVDVAAKRIITDKPVVIKPAVSSYTQRFVTGFYVYSVEDLVARKLHALTERTEGKDVYDVHAALALCGDLTSAIRKMLASENLNDDPVAFLQKTIRALKKVDHRKMRNLTNPFIPLSIRPSNWLALKNDLIFKLETLSRARKK